MNRQPYLDKDSNFYYYDEDTDRRMNFTNGVSARFVVRKKVPKPTAWRVIFTLPDNECVGSITHVRGYNLFLWRRGTKLDARIRGLATLDDALKGAHQLIGMIFP